MTTLLDCDLSDCQDVDISRHKAGRVALLSKGTQKVSGCSEVHVYHGLCFGAFLEGDTQVSQVADIIPDIQSGVRFHWLSKNLKQSFLKLNKSSH